MTINALFSKINKEKPNSFEESDLLEFVNEIEAEVAEQLKLFTPTYTLDDKEKELLAPRPYDRLYVSYVKAMIDYANEEYASYQLNAEQHVQDFRDFISWVVRSEVSKQTELPTRLRNIF